MRVRIGVRGGVKVRVGVTVRVRGRVRLRVRRPFFPGGAPGVGSYVKERA